MRFLAALSLCLLVPSVAAGKPSRHGVDAFAGDRWERVAQAGTTAADVNRTMRCPPPHCSRKKVIKRKWRKRHRPAPGAVSPMVKAAPIPIPLARPAGAPEADEEAAAANAAWERIAESLKPRRTLNIFEGFAREIERALPGRSLAGVVPPLAAKVREIVSACGSRIGSTIRCTRVAGTRRMSLHCAGKAVDISGNPSCIYAHLRHWPGGYSTDYGTVRCGRRPCPHVHISYDPQGKREWRARFAHRGGTKRTRYARRIHKQQYASVR